MKNVSLLTACLLSTTLLGYESQDPSLSYPLSSLEISFEQHKLREFKIQAKGDALEKLSQKALDSKISKETPLQNIDEEQGFQNDFISKKMIEEKIHSIGFKELENINLRYALKDQTFYAPHRSKEVQNFKILDLKNLSSPMHFDKSALEYTAKEIASYFHQKGFIGVTVSTKSDEIDANGRDLRAQKNQLTLLIHSPITLHLGNEKGGDERKKTQNPKDSESVKEKIQEKQHPLPKKPPSQYFQPLIKKKSHREKKFYGPFVKPPLDSVKIISLIEKYEDSPETKKPVKQKKMETKKSHPKLAKQKKTNKSRRNIKKNTSDHLRYYLNKHKGSSPLSFQSGFDSIDRFPIKLSLHPNNPRESYFLISNSGSKTTARYMERLGTAYYHTLFPKDLLRLEYATTSLKHFNMIAISYAFPIQSFSQLYNKFDLYWGSFSAADVGLIHENFSGIQKKASYRLWKKLQTSKRKKMELFLEIQALNLAVNYKDLQEQAHNSLLIPKVGALFKGKNSLTKWEYLISYESNIPSLAQSNEKTLHKLGRSTNEIYWSILKGHLQLSRFITSVKNPRTHEVHFYTEGQYAFGKRLIPQMEKKLGGAHTVRGYPQYTSSAPSALLGSFEYRNHKNLFRGKDMHKKSRYRILRLFLDAGLSSYHRPIAHEKSASLASVGFGCMWIFKKNLEVQADCAMALTNVQSAHVQRGNLQLHFNILKVF